MPEAIATPPRFRVGQKVSLADCKDSGIVKVVCWVMDLDPQHWHKLGWNYFVLYDDGMFDSASESELEVVS